MVLMQLYFILGKSLKIKVQILKIYDWVFSNYKKTLTILKTEYLIHFPGRHFRLKIMSNEQLIVSYRDAIKSGKEKEWIRILKDEILRRGLTPLKNRAMNN
jgi:hypothetical protein